MDKVTQIEPKTKKVIVRVEPSLHRKVREKCRRLDVTLAQQVRRFLREWVDDEGGQ